MKTKKKRKLKQAAKMTSKLFVNIYKLLIKYKNDMKKLFLFLIITSAIILNACNVTRVVTTSSECHQRGDTSVLIQTKTTETYNGEIRR